MYTNNRSWYEQQRTDATRERNFGGKRQQEQQQQRRQQTQQWTHESPQRGELDRESRRSSRKERLPSHHPAPPKQPLSEDELGGKEEGKRFHHGSQKAKITADEEANARKEEAKLRGKEVGRAWASRQKQERELQEQRKKRTIKQNKGRLQAREEPWSTAGSCNREPSHGFRGDDEDHDELNRKRRRRLLSARHGVASGGSDDQETNREERHLSPRGLMRTCGSSVNIAECHSDDQENEDRMGKIQSVRQKQAVGPDNMKSSVHHNTEVSFQRKRRDQNKHAAREVCLGSGIIMGRGDAGGAAPAIGEPSLLPPSPQTPPQRAISRGTHRTSDSSSVSHSGRDADSREKVRGSGRISGHKSDDRKMSRFSTNSKNLELNQGTGTMRFIAQHQHDHVVNGGGSSCWLPPSSLMVNHEAATADEDERDTLFRCSTIAPPLLECRPPPCPRRTERRGRYLRPEPGLGLRLGLRPGLGLRAVAAQNCGTGTLGVGNGLGVGGVGVQRPGFLRAFVARSSPRSHQRAQVASVPAASSYRGALLPRAEVQGHAASSSERMPSSSLAFGSASVGMRHRSSITAAVTKGARARRHGGDDGIIAASGAGPGCATGMMQPVLAKGVGKGTLSVSVGLAQHAGMGVEGSGTLAHATTTRSGGSGAGLGTLALL